MFSDSKKSCSSPVVFTDIPFNSQQVCIGLYCKKILAEYHDENMPMEYTEIFSALEMKISLEKF